MKAINTDGFGNSNNEGIVYMVEHEGVLYAGVSNAVDGTVVMGSRDGENWKPVSDHGFGNARNIGIVRMRSWKGYLYAGLWNLTEGAELWRSKSPYDGDTWEQLASGGFGEGPANQAVGSIRWLCGHPYRSKRVRRFPAGQG